MSLVRLGGADASAARMQVPAWGRGWADVSLTDPVELAGAQVLTFADVTVKCFVVSGGAIHGRSAYRVVFGAGGWARDVAKRSYLDDSGVKLSSVLGDVARDAGETLVDIPATRVGRQYARAAGPASDILHILAQRNWYTDFAGVTHVGQRAQTEYRGSAPRTRVDTAVGVIELATDQIAGILPGVIVDGSLPATDVEFELDSSRLVARVYAGRGRSRRLDALARILAALDPLRKYRGTYEFRVVQQVGERFNLQPVRAASGMPDLPRVPVRGAPGIRADVQLGELVLVTFADCDPSRPQLIAHDSPDAPGFMPTELDLGPKAGAKLVVLDGDSIDLSLVTFGGDHAVGTATVTASGAKVKAAP